MKLRKAMMAYQASTRPALIRRTEWDSLLGLMPVRHMPHAALKVVNKNMPRYTVKLLNVGDILAEDWEVVTL